MRLALAEIAAIRGQPAAARAHLARARCLYPLSSSLAEQLERTWREARIAATSGDDATADRLFDRARQALLERGSFAEAARCTLDQLLLRIGNARGDTVPDLIAALAAAFPATDGRWPGVIDALARLQRLGREVQPGSPAQPNQQPGGDPSRLDLAAHELKRRLARAAAHDSGRPALLRPARVLADRLLRWRGEHEDMIGAAEGV